MLVSLQGCGKSTTAQVRLRLMTSTAVSSFRVLDDDTLYSHKVMENSKFGCHMFLVH